MRQCTSNLRLIVGLLVLGTMCSCAESDAGRQPVDCTDWNLIACETFHACGMMQGVGDCAQHVEGLCGPETVQPEPEEQCDDLTVDDIDACVEAMDRTGCENLTFEALEQEIPECTPFIACFGWPM